MKKYAFLLLLPLLMAGGGAEGPEQKPIIIETPAPEVIIEEGQPPWLIALGIIVPSLTAIIVGYLGATGQFTKEGRKERKNKKRLSKERGDFAKKESEK